ncbi:MAG TPA: cellulase family glycosylhydrolase [Solirubrobacteraceae bacterium]
MRAQFSKLAVLWILVALTLVLLAATDAQSGTASAPKPPLSGVNLTDFAIGTSTAKINQEIARAQSLHAHVIRVEFPWSAFEPNQQGQVDPSALTYSDYLVNRASAAGIKVLVLTLSTPCWASSAPPSLLAVCTPNTGSRANTWPPSEPRAFGSFVAFIAARYGSKLAAIEIWNEPDQANEDYLAGPNKAQHYAAILRAAYPAIKRADPAMTVLGGSLVGSNGTFLRALYAAGIKGYYDGLAVHFYNLTLASLRYTHEVQFANGDSKPLWLTEFGWSSCWPRQRIQEEQACVTPQVQAANMSNIYRSLARIPWVAAQIVYELQGSTREDFGVFAESGARKPSFAALRNVFISAFAKPSPVTVSLNRHGGRLVADGSGPVGDYMRLEAFRGRHAVYRTLFTLNSFNRYSVALPSQLGTRNLAVRVFQYWMGPATAAAAHI